MQNGGQVTFMDLKEQRTQPTLGLEGWGILPTLCWGREAVPSPRKCRGPAAGAGSSLEGLLLPESL